MENFGTVGPVRLAQGRPRWYGNEAGRGRPAYMGSKCSRPSLALATEGRHALVPGIGKDAGRHRSARTDATNTLWER